MSILRTVARVTMSDSYDGFDNRMLYASAEAMSFGVVVSIR